jgi:adenine-specific DNA-methyltransferase
MSTAVIYNPYIEHCLDQAVDYSPQFETVIQALGPPEFESDDVLLYNRDCLTSLQELPVGVFDLTVTSPPYNIGKEYEQKLLLEEYIAWSKDWISQVFRTTRPSGAFWLNLGYVPFPGRGKAVPLPYLIWQICPFYLIQEIVWNYGAGVASRHSFSPRNEKFLWFVKDEMSYTFNLDDVRDKDVKYPFQKKNGKLKCNPHGKNPTDVWTFPKVTSGKDRASSERTPHPAQFPLAVIERIILACSRRGDHILEPFLGSGTTAEAALKLGRKVVGFEIRKDYFDIAVKRILDYKKMRHIYLSQEVLPLG